MLKKLLLLFHTIRHLKFTQIYYQFKYRLMKPKALAFYKGNLKQTDLQSLIFKKQLLVYKTYLGDNKFSFLNLEKDFEDKIDWNYQDFGKLWNYNLQYFNYLLQEDILLEEKLCLLRDFYKAVDRGLLELEPYPVSLRSINMIRLFSKEGVKDADLLANLYGELNFLSQRLEYHLLANHLLENAFALMMGGAFFSNEAWLKTAQSILEKELEEQTLLDGAHYELSPMYHQIILFRVLELYDWYSQWENNEASFIKLLKTKAELMLSWLDKISFSNGDIPHFNDSTNEISFRTEDLMTYAKNLDLNINPVPLSDSGYRTLNKEAYEIRLDFAQIAPSYQPGHAHADALSFILYHKDKPLFVEQGTSTYNIGERRSLERSTQAHNCVVVDNQNQSQVWSGFRVGKRAKTSIIKDEATRLVASHDGYKSLGVIHQRSFEFKEGRIQITDGLSNPNKTAVFYLHLHPSRKITQHLEAGFIVDESIHINFENAEDIQVESYQYADTYNEYIEAKRILVKFVGVLETRIEFR